MANVFYVEKNVALERRESPSRKFGSFFSRRFSWGSLFVFLATTPLILEIPSGVANVCKCLKTFETFPAVTSTKKQNRCFTEMPFPPRGLQNGLLRETGVSKVLPPLELF